MYSCTYTWTIMYIHKHLYDNVYTLSLKWCGNVYIVREDFIDTILQLKYRLVAHISSPWHYQHLQNYTSRDQLRGGVSFLIKHEAWPKLVRNGLFLVLWYWKVGMLKSRIWQESYFQCKVNSRSLSWANLQWTDSTVWGKYTTMHQMSHNVQWFEEEVENKNAVIVYVLLYNITV